MQNARLKQVRAQMKQDSLDQVIITQPQSIYYLTGLWVEPFDRLDALVITHSRCKMLCYVLAVIEPEDCEVIVYKDTGKTCTALSALLEDVPTGVDGYLASRFLLPLQQSRPHMPMFVSRCIEQARMIKEADEVDKLRFASRITDDVFRGSFAQLRAGMTELELGAVFSDCFLQSGVGRFNGDPMVCFGAGSAQPHHAPCSAKLCAGDTVSVDTGKRIDGYFSDMTRTVFYQSCSAKQRQIYEIVLEANLTAIAAVHEGVTMREIDLAARGVIEKAGYADFYPHRTSHGIGIDCHEEPFDMDGRTLTVESNMCFSIEPGIYLPGEFGVRIEDLVCVTKNGCELLSRHPKELLIVES